MEKNKVLIVDDEPKICSILSALLTKSGYEVQVANCGEAGLDTYEKFGPAVHKNITGCNISAGLRNYCWHWYQPVFATAPTAAKLSG